MRKQNSGATMKLLISALLIAVSVTPALTQARLKAQTTVAGDVVRIGDLVENAGMVANTPIFRAPDLGQTGAVSSRTVRDAVSSHGLITVDMPGPEEGTRAHMRRITSICSVDE